MKSLLNNKFAPLTHQMGFLEATLERTMHVFLQWQSEIGAELNRQPQHELLVGSLEQALARLEPLTTPPTKFLLLETRSRWTALFDNGLRMSDPESPVGHLCTIIPCKGVVVHCAPDRSQTRHRDAIRIYGTVSFSMFSPHQTSWLNQERSVVAMNDGGTWLFSAAGIPQPFEEPQNYKAPHIADRFTDEMLERYCKALGINLFDDAFYGIKGAVIKTVQKLAPGSPTATLENAQSRTLS